MPSRRSSSSIVSALSPLDVSRALHLDFEGLRDAPPCFAGVQVDGAWSATVFSDVAPRLVPAAEAKGLVVDTLDRFLSTLVDRAVDESRRIACFSTRERVVFRERGIGGDDLGGRYVNTLELARAWRRTRHPAVAEEVAAMRRRARRRGKWVGGRGNRLLDFAALASLPGCRNYGKHRTTSRLRHVMGQLERRGTYESLTNVAKWKWTGLIEHNRWDCAASAALAALAVDRGGSTNAERTRNRDASS